MTSLPEQPLVTVVLPTHNRAHAIRAALESVLNQTYSNTEIIVVDDGSTDDTEQIVSSLRDERVVYVKQTVRTGSAGARNFGISLAKGEFIAFQDSDDLWYRDKLEKQVPVLTSLPKSYGMVYSHMMLRLPEGDVLFKPSSRGRQEHSALDRMLCGSTGIGIQTCLIRRECFSKVGGIDTNLRALDDREFFIRFSQYFDMYELSVPLVTYIVGDDSISRNTLDSIKAQKYIMKKYSSYLQRNCRALAFHYFLLAKFFIAHKDYRSAGAAFRIAARLRPEPGYVFWALLLYRNARLFKLIRRAKRLVYWMRQQIVKHAKLLLCLIFIVW